MAESTVVRNKRGGVVVISDSGAAHTYTVAYEPGDFQYAAPGYSVNTYLDRGEIGTTPSVRKVDEQVMTGSFSAYLRDVGSATYATLPDICHPYSGGYVATNWTSTLGTASDAFLLSVALTIDGSAFGEADKTLTFPYAKLDGSAAEGDPDTYSVSFSSSAYRPTFA